MSSDATAFEQSFIRRVQQIEDRDEAIRFLRRCHRRQIALFARHIDAGILEDGDVQHLLDMGHVRASVVANESLPTSRLTGIIESRALDWLARVGSGGEGIRDTLDMMEHIRGWAPRERLANLARERIRGKKDDRETRRKWAHHLCSETFEFTEDDARLIGGLLGTERSFATMLIEHERTPKDLIEAIFHRFRGFTSDGTSIEGAEDRVRDLIVSLSSSETALEVPEIRQAVMESQNTYALIRAAVFLNPAEIRTIFERLVASDPSQCIHFLADIPPSCRRTITREMLVPLLENEDASVRVQAQTFLGEVGERPEAHRSRGLQ